MNRNWSMVTVATALLVGVVGCDRAHTLSEIEAQERSTRLYTNAMDDYRAGRLDAAIKGFERVVLDEPKSYSAHFQLATLLHDVRKDYIGAIAHYRAYLALRPASDKANVATDRVKLCETLLAADIVKKAAVGPESLKREIQKLTDERDALVEKGRKLEFKLAEAEKTIAGLRKDNESQHAIIARFSEETDVQRPARAKEALAELAAMEAESRRRSMKPTDAELLDEDTPPSRTRNVQEIRDLRAEAENEEKADAQNRLSHSVTTNRSGFAMDSALGRKKKKVATVHPDTYIVQEGDTLFAISTKFFGNATKWRAIRELNKATVPLDGRLRVGQVIRLPR